MGHEGLQQVRYRSVGSAGGARNEPDLGRGVGCPQFQQLVENQSGGFRVGHSPVGLVVLDVQPPGQGAQVVFGHGGKKYRGQVPGVVTGVGQVKAVGRQERKVEGDVVPDDGQITNEGGKLGRNLLEPWRPLDLGRADGGQLLDEGWDLPPRVDEGLVAFQNLTTAKLDGSHLDNGIGLRLKSGGLQVDTHELALEYVTLRQQRRGHRHNLPMGSERRLRGAQAIRPQRSLPEPFQGTEITPMERGDELGLVEDFIGKLGDKLAQPVRAVSVAAAGDGEVQTVGDLGGEAVFVVGRAAVGDLNGVDQLEHRMLHGRIGILGDRILGIGIEQGTGAVVLGQDASERVRRHHEATHGVGSLAQFLGAMESALVPVDAKSQDVAHVRVRFHGADKDHVVPSGESGEFVPVPGTRMFGDAQAA